jgi:hypothetical protein
LSLVTKEKPVGTSVPIVMSAPPKRRQIKPHQPDLFLAPGNDRFFATEGYAALGLLRPAQVDTNADAAQHGVSQFLADSGVETSNDIDREIEAAVTGIEAKICTAGWFQRDE